MSRAFLSIRNVTKKFSRFTALDRVSLDIGKNEFVCLLGPSGCGKTTLLSIIAGLEKPDEGRILLDGRDISLLSPADRNFGMVFQSYALFPNMTTSQNIAYGLKSRKKTKKEIAEKVREVLALVDLEYVRDRYPSQLSGGQQQRVALARAVALSPDFLLLDEPLSALDAKVRSKLRREIRVLQEKTGITTIMVTHDQEEALTMADRIAVMMDGGLVQIGTPQEVYERPASPFVADFIGEINFLEERVVPGEEGRAEPILAVRPEHVALREGKEGKAGGVPGVVQDVEFRGPFYRVVLQVSDAEGRLTGQVVTIDISAKDCSSFQLEKGKKYSVSIPGDRLISFDGNAGKWKQETAL